MTLKIATFDLFQATSENYELAYYILAQEFGLYQTTPAHQPPALALPSTTVMGASWLDTGELRTKIKEAFEANGLNLSSLFVGEIWDWAATTIQPE